MGISDYNNGSSNGSYQNNKPYENTYYSRVRFKNGNRQLNINYHSGLMQIDIGAVDSNDRFKVNSEGSVYLSPNKAQLLAGQITEFFRYMESDKINPSVAFGVNTGMGEKVSFIGFSTDEDRKIYVTVGKFDGSGTITEHTKFEFAYDYHFALNWKDINSNDIEKVYDNFIEIKMLQAALYDFSKAMMGASAYGVVDMARWDVHRMNKRVDQIFDKLGIERASNNGGNRSYGGSNNFLSGASAGSSKATSYEDVEDLLV